MSPTKKDKARVTAGSPSKVQKTSTPRGDRKRFTANEVFLYQVIKTSKTKIDYDALSKVLGKTKGAASQQMGRFTKGMEEFLKKQDMIEKNDDTYQDEVDGNEADN
ncbi:uncharacterized protein PGRI_007570 [Penicillium griseofulvum]|uniref:Myb-like DNA-binding domain-containing protein n=1 Tax=Penicillium patulum TaxID=5078 RepID=A0A135LXK5_PENPA|nr:uncharacterized protein PGRI_007570 [Penicillium griseofulvum]KXG53707.1 hypothetical protein PGRI_007570 [Penicillium griseofulvum]